MYVSSTQLSSVSFTYAQILPCFTVFTFPDLFRDSSQSAEEHGNLSPAFTTFLQECVQFRGIIAGELVIIIDDVVGSLRAQSLLMH